MAICVDWGNSLTKIFVIFDVQHIRERHGGDVYKVNKKIARYLLLTLPDRAIADLIILFLKDTFDLIT